MTLNEVKINKTITVKAFNSDDQSKITKLTAMGIIPGSILKVIQKKPLLVFQTGYSKFAIDNNLASIIEIEKQDTSAD